jgi:RNA polymerase sigma factor (sigma-70 family)
MPTVLSGLIRNLKTDLTRDGETVTDGTLLERFLGGHEDAFGALVGRHGPMVLGVCRRLLGNAQDAEDAFQATFLVAVRKADSVRPRDLFGNWLYGVAYRTALEARHRIARRTAREKQMANIPHPLHTDPEAGEEELRHLLDRELSRLPEKYRVPIVLCELQGRSRRDVARHLHLPEGTLSSRLATARKWLARRLSRHLPALSIGSLASFLAGDASATVPPTLLRSTIQAATLARAGQVVAAIASPHVVALSEGVLKAMLLSKLKVASFFALVVVAMMAGAAVAGAAMTGYCAGAGDPVPALQTASGQLETEEVNEQNAPDAGQLDGEEADEQKAPKKRQRAEGDTEVIKGSGDEATKELKLSGFTSVEVGAMFQVQITQAKSFRVVVTADDNVLPYVKVTKEGSTLKIGLEGKRLRLQKVTLKVAITMPRLAGVSASGASKVELKGIKSNRDCKVRASGASHLKGDLQAGNLDLEASGASHVSLTGSARSAKLAGNGASHLALAGLTLRSANVVLSGASHAKVNVASELDYKLSGASHLQYVGEPKIGTKKVSGASRAAGQAQ